MNKTQTSNELFNQAVGAFVDEQFDKSNESNVWHTQHMRVEDAMETELNR